MVGVVVDLLEVGVEQMSLEAEVEQMSLAVEVELQGLGEVVAEMVVYQADEACPVEQSLSYHLLNGRSCC